MDAAFPGQPQVKKLGFFWVFVANKVTAKSYAKAHLANERTYLAWMRLAYSSIGLGLASTKLKFTNFSFEIGLLLICVCNGNYTWFGQ